MEAPPDATDNPRGDGGLIRVTAAKGRVRAGPSTEQPILANLDQGAVVEWDQRQEGWYRIQAHGWIFRSIVELGGQGELQVVSQGVGRVRATPAIDAAVVVKVRGESCGWHASHVTEAATPAPCL